MDNREITEETLQRADSFRVQIQLKNREYKILYGGVYNWIARKFPEVAAIIRDALTELIMTRLKQELKTIAKSNPNALTSLDAFLEYNIPEEKILHEARNIITEIIK